MDPLVQVAIITAIPATVAAIVGALSLYVSWSNGKKLAKTDEKLIEVSKNVDGKLEDLKTALGRAERSEGREEGQDKERAAQLVANPPREGPELAPASPAAAPPAAAPAVLNLTVQPTAPTDLDVGVKVRKKPEEPEEPEK